MPVPVEGLLCKKYAATRRALIDPERAAADPTFGKPAASSGTVRLPAAAHSHCRPLLHSAAAWCAVTRGRRLTCSLVSLCALPGRYE